MAQPEQVEPRRLHPAAVIGEHPTDRDLGGQVAVEHDDGDLELAELREQRRVRLVEHGDHEPVDAALREERNVRRLEERIAERVGQKQRVPVRMERRLDACGDLGDQRVRDVSDDEADA